ncbi:hypothetical protein ARMSODRAFT_1027995 [Armillaria solidipes]|uniref:Uncharacterized protein n=1 Tax=Armillaria solidipes TaxID=1076256 RepID=A0A2H3B6U1_9AGAR|nr:hypothetical protein ARMSODRAFT_1027995 [Armillaria solidipes]
MAVAILAPEVIVAWAAEQFIVAWKVCHSEYLPRLRELSGLSSTPAGTDISISSVIDAWRGRKEKHAPNLTMAHGFVLSMGGFCYTKVGHISPSSSSPSTILSKHATSSRTITLSILDLDHLDSHSHLIKKLEEISAETIEDKSKGDGLSKTISILQISWFIAQCAARSAQRIPITLLEMTALAFAGLSVITYCLWWYKPLNIKYHISLDNLNPSSDTRPSSGTYPLQESGSPAESNTKKDASSWSHLSIQPVINGLLEWLFSGTLRAVSGGIGYDIEDRGGDIENGAFRFSSGTRCQAPWARIGIMVTVGSIFGAFHCTAWSFYFLSYAEMVLWRYASMTVLVGLVVAFLPTGYLLVVDTLPGWMKLPRSCTDLRLWIGFREFIFMVLTRTGTVAYIVARIILIALAFIQLCFLPPLAFYTVNGPLICLTYNFSYFPLFVQILKFSLHIN